MRPKLLVTLSLLVLTACTSAPSVPTEALDRETGATVTTPAQPLLFAPVQETASRQFSYVTVVAVDVNQNSQHQSLLLAYYWFGVSKDVDPAPRTLRMVADDQVIELHPEAGTPRDFGIAALPHAPARGFALAPLVYRCEPAVWRLLASARQLTVQVGSTQDPWPRYEIWNDGRPALRQMLEQLQP
ncbi:MAG: hypothetical protein ABIT36_10595 [Steroidobacteraceae bacterium]